MTEKQFHFNKGINIQPNLRFINKLNIKPTMKIEQKEIIKKYNLKINI